MCGAATGRILRRTVPTTARMLHSPIAPCPIRRWSTIFWARLDRSNAQIELCGTIRGASMIFQIRREAGDLFEPRVCRNQSSLRL